MPLVGIIKFSTCFKLCGTVITNNIRYFRGVSVLIISFICCIDGISEGWRETAVHCVIVQLQKIKVVPTIDLIIKSLLYADLESISLVI